VVLVVTVILVVALVVMAVGVVARVGGLVLRELLAAVKTVEEPVDLVCSVLFAG
jgi:hypothetical protein